LLSKRETTPEWYKEVRIDTITPFFEHSFFDEHYIMLYGFAEQRVNEEYKIRSFLLAETFFIKKNKNFEQLKQIVPSLTLNWDMDIHASRDHINYAYFGELYWADNMMKSSLETIYIPTGKKISIKRRLGREDISLIGKFRRIDIGTEIEQTQPERLSFDSEPTLIEYSWESESNIFKGYSEYYPSINMGKHFKLRAEPSKGVILDSNHKECFQCIDFKDQFFHNSFNYIRSDLIRSYMDDNNLALLYQVKQHSYEENVYNNRLRRFFILE
jgi:hypothetical protein